KPYDLLFGERKSPDGTQLGRPPGNGRKVADLYAALLVAEPYATAERKRELRTEAVKKARQSPLFFDLTISLSNSPRFHPPRVVVVLSPGIRPGGTIARQRPALGARITASGCTCSNRCLRSTGSSRPSTTRRSGPVLALAHPRIACQCAEIARFSASDVPPVSTSPALLIAPQVPPSTVKPW